MWRDQVHDGYGDSDLISSSDLSDLSDPSDRSDLYDLYDLSDLSDLSDLCPLIASIRKNSVWATPITRTTVQ